MQSDCLLSADVRTAQTIAQLFHPVLYSCMSTVLELSQEEIGLSTGLLRQHVSRAL